MKDFVAIDFETANGNRSSICSVGVVVVRNNEVVDSFYSLIKPAPNYYAWFCQEVHDLDYCDTDDAPLFPEVWQQIEDLLAKHYAEELTEMSSDETRTYNLAQCVTMVAHNAGFDEGCLRAVFHTYQMDYPEYIFYDTLSASRHHFGSTLPNHQLQTVAAACGYDLSQHHHALADAEACAAIAIEIL